jgi:hypothetical protein
MSRRKTTEEFIKEANIVHKRKYDYSKTEYGGCKKYVLVICHEKDENGVEHGFFKQRADHHLNGCGCQKCARNVEMTTEEFITKANIKHKKKYDYSETVYKNSDSEITIICPIHGPFKQTPYKHLNGQGCPKCAGKHKTTEDFIKEAKLIHKGKYTYETSVYRGTDEELLITCPIHGPFKQTPYKHLKRKQGCPKCVGKHKTTEEFIKEAKLIHKEKYDYSLTEYIGVNYPIKVICHKQNRKGEEHGLFTISPHQHLHKKTGCPKCGCVVSKEETYLKKYLHSIDIKIEQSNRKLGFEIDLYSSEYKIGVEFDGIYWHSKKYGKDTNYHLNKTKKCQENGIRLIHIFEDEWNEKQEIVKSRLENIFGKTPNKIYARKCEIREVSSKEYKEFMENNHLQGGGLSSVRVGLFYDGELVSCMGFRKPQQMMRKVTTGYELIRFANKLHTDVVGGASKLLKYFIKTYNPVELISYADLRWSQGELYEKLGFEKEKTTGPTYEYVVGNQRKHRYYLLYNLKLSKEEMEKYPKIYDCGKIRYKWTKKE